MYFPSNHQADVMKNYFVAKDSLQQNEEEHGTLAQARTKRTIVKRLRPVLATIVNLMTK